MFQPRVSPKQAAVINDLRRYILVTGPRLSSKTFGVLNRFAWRMWSIPNYVGCIVAKTASNASDSGVWSVLTEKVMPDWIYGRKYTSEGIMLPASEWEPFGLEWATQPRSTGITHKMYFETLNRVGGTSRMYLDSLDIEDEVEAKFKGRFFTEIMLSEASLFKKRETFDCLSECLRTPDVPQEMHALICDTNPPEDGMEHFLAKIFFWLPSIDLDNINDDTRKELNLEGLDDEMLAEVIISLKEMQAQTSVHRFKVSDNCFISPAQQRAQFAKYCHNAQLLARYFHGDWVTASGEGIFGEVWRPSIHLVGERPTPLNPNPEQMLPEVECIELGSGSDIGSRRNTGFAIIEPVPVLVEEYGQAVNKIGFKILDEYVSIGRQQKIWETADAMLERVEYWEALCKKPPLWHHLSDNSSFDVSGQTETSEAQDIFIHTNGKIELKSVVIPGMNIKGPGGIERGVDLIARLLFENRLWVNAATCPETAEMFHSIKRNKAGRLSTANPLKHILDAVRYYCAWKAWLEMRLTSFRGPRTSTDPNSGRVVVTRL